MPPFPELVNESMSLSRLVIKYDSSSDCGVGPVSADVLHLDAITTRNAQMSDPEINYPFLGGPNEGIFLLKMSYIDTIKILCQTNHNSLFPRACVTR